MQVFRLRTAHIGPGATVAFDSTSVSTCLGISMNSLRGFTKDGDGFASNRCMQK